ncbi:MAG: efflux RND transporter permease subunit [Chitinispirillales bacterium]|jgi:HAE1 family hydrophobic/amphiphilic exporter-1|nr:efflux RND transporter permease subunit [Chitinispirillales bacterium]
MSEHSLISLPIRRPILITVIYLIVIVIGAFSLLRLPIDLMPEITMPTVSVITDYENAGSQEVEELITRPIESALAGIQGIEEITSTSSEGRSVVRVTFPWNSNLDYAVNDMRDRIDRILGMLPEEIDRPLIRKFDVSAMPIMILGVTVQDKDISEIQQILEDQVQYRLERVAGVASVDIRGGQKRQIHVDLRSASMEAYGISTDMVVTALKRENKNIPAGSIISGNRDITVRTLAEYRGADDVNNTVVTVSDGVPIRIADIAEVKDGYEDVKSFVRINGVMGIRLSVSKQSGSNTVAVANGVKKEIQRINRDIEDIEIIALVDNAKYVENSIKSVTQSLIMGGSIAIFVLLLFLRNITTTMIISVAIPISVIATFALIYFCGFTLNMMTFGGLALGIGMLLDNAIVVLDNIFHKREKGMGAYEGAIKGVSEVSSAVIASTLTTLVVFIPVIFMRGMSGIMFQSLAYVVAFSISCSLLVALTFVPMLTTKFLRSESIKHTNDSNMAKIFQVSERFYVKIEHRYKGVIHWALHNRLTVIVFVFALFALSFFALPLVGVDLMPATDESDVRVNVEMEIGTKLEILDETVRKIESIIRKEVPEAIFTLSNIASGMGSQAVSGNTAQIRISLVPKNKRSRSSIQVAEQLRPKLSGLPGTTVRVREGQGMFLLRMGTNTDQAIGIEIRGYDLETGQTLAKQINDAVSEISGITETQISREAGMPEYRVKIDRGKAAELGLSATQIGSTVQTAMGGTSATKVRVDGKEYSVMVRLAEDDRKSIDNVSNLSVMNSSNRPILLQSAAQIETGIGPVKVERRDRERIVTVSVNYAGRDMKSVVEDIRSAIKDISIPQEFVVLIRGDWEEQQKAQRELFFGIAMAITLIFLVMAGQFESLKDPLIVIFSIPMALTGVVAIMLITRTPFTIQAFIGCIILVGVVVNNAIILVDMINRLYRDEEMELFTAIEITGERRLRPILMTTLSTILGLLPMAIGIGEGSESQVPMARVIIGGLTVSTVITLVFIPVIYSLVEHKIKKRGKAVQTA